MKIRMLFFGLFFLVLIPIFSCKKDGPAGKQNSLVFYTQEQFCMGADLSYVNQILDFGGAYKDSGQVKDPYLLFKQHGANTIRLRLWYNPLWTKEVYGDKGVKMYNDINDVTQAIAHIRELGMHVLLDIHYSDTWADPGNQTTPAAWSDTSFNTLVDSVYQYTYRVLSGLASQNLMPEMVQVGNEINCGLLFPLGNGCNNGWKATGDLLNSGIKAVRDASLTSNIKPKVLLHVAQPENLGWWLNSLKSVGKVTDFDIIGFSYYYMWSTVPLESVSNYVSLAKTTYNKPVMILETAYPWTIENADSYNNIIDPSKLDVNFPATREGQYNYLVKLTQEVIDGGGTGLFYWEPGWITSPIKDLWGSGSAWDCNTFFDFNGNSIQGINYMVHSYKGLIK